MSAGRKFAFVIPRYFEGIAGGAETLISALARKLAERGNDVEILATCARDNRSWENAFPAGATKESGLTVRRFSVDPRDLEVWIPRQIQISEGMHIGIDEELRWMEHSVNSRDLYAFIAQNAKNFAALFFGPYLFGTTFWGSLIAPERSVLIPCLHDECFAYTATIGAMFRLLRRAIFNCEAEAELARALYGQIEGAEVGMGFDSVSAETTAKLAPFYDLAHPYLLYVGRKETMKNVQGLIDCFIEAKDRSLLNPRMKLVILGGGSFSDLHRPEALQRDDVIDAPHVCELDKQRIIRHACALVQPSNNESFSIVLMEAWLLGVPVLVSAACAVTRGHVVASGGGLYYDNAAEFAFAAAELEGNSDLRERLGASGMRYVLERYSWKAVLARFDAALLACGLGAAAGAHLEFEASSGTS